MFYNYTSIYFFYRKKKDSISLPAYMIYVELKDYQNF